MKEREISLVDLVLEILLHWRGIIIAMLIGGLLLGTVGYGRANVALRAQTKDQEEIEQKVQKWQGQSETGQLEMEEAYLREELTETQLANVNTALTYKALYEDMLVYQQQSELMKIDPMNAARAELTFQIFSEDMERTYNLQSLYRNLLTGSGLYEWLVNERGMSSSVNELISLDNSTIFANGNILLTQDTLGVTIYYPDEEGCKALKELVSEYLQDKHRDLSGTVGEHEIVLLDDSFSYVVNTGLMDKQRNYAVNIASYQTSYSRAVDALEEDEKRYYRLQLAKQGDILEDDILDEESEENAQENSAGPLTRVSVLNSAVKYLILGMLLAAFLSAFVLFLRYIMNSRLRMADNLNDIYGISQMGTISQEKRQKRFLNVIDQWIMALRNHGKRIFTTQEALTLAIAAVKISALKNDLTKVAIAGCDMKETVLSYVDQMKEQLAEEGIELLTLNNILYDAEAMERLTDIQAAVLMETVGSTLYTEVEQELEMLKRQGVMVLGGILTE